MLQYLDADIDLGECIHFVGGQDLFPQVEVQKDEVWVESQIRHDHIVIVVEKFVSIEGITPLEGIFVVGLVDGCLENLEREFIDAIA